MKTLLLILIKVLCLFFIAALPAKSQTTEPITVTDQSINIPGVMVVSAWQGQNANKPYPDYPKMHYAFAQDDELIIDFSSNNRKGTQRIVVSEFESQSVAYSNNAFQTLEDVRIRIPKTSIYKFEFATNHLIDRQCKVIIKRIPASEATCQLQANPDPAMIQVLFIQNKVPSITN